MLLRNVKTLKTAIRTICAVKIWTGLLIHLHVSFLHLSNALPRKNFLIFFDPRDGIRLYLRRTAGYTETFNHLCLQKNYSDNKTLDILVLGFYTVYTHRVKPKTKISVFISRWKSEIKIKTFVFW
jgi:hypothetical protein